MNTSAKYFFNRCHELLHKHSFDTYRVSLHNPYTIFHELDRSIEKYNKKRIKHFNPTITSIGAEALNILKIEHIPEVLKFGDFSINQIIEFLDKNCVKEKKDFKLRTIWLISKTICINNEHFTSKLFKQIKQLINDNNDEEQDKLDLNTSWLISQLLFNGYSRKYLSDRIKRAQLSFKIDSDVEKIFINLKGLLTNNPEDYKVIFKIKNNSEEKIELGSLEISELNKFPQEHIENTSINEKFKTKSDDEYFYEVEVKSLDFWSALNQALSIFSESVELNTLNASYAKIVTENQAVVIHTKSAKLRITTIEENVDGFYEYSKTSFKRFIDNYNKNEQGSIAKEKLKSAIRFYKLGNDSLEIEHKLLNYWIGFEQLFSAVEGDEDSINRIKAFFIPINSVFYWQRKIQYLLKSINRNKQNISIEQLTDDGFDLSIITNPLIKRRAMLYREQLKDTKKIRAAIENHKQRLDQHLTRIYRVRNELVHEGRSVVDLFLIAGHLRHYLLFSIEQITNELAEQKTIQCLDDVFVYFENLLIRIESAKDIQEIFSIKKYDGYME